MTRINHAWLARFWDRHDDVMSLWSSEEKARAFLASYVRDLWDRRYGGCV